MSNIFKTAMLSLQVFVLLAAFCSVLPRVETLAMAQSDEELPCVGPEWEGCGNVACPVHQENNVPVLKCLNTSSLCNAINDCPVFFAVDEGSMAIEFAPTVLIPQLECNSLRTASGLPEFLCQTGQGEPIGLSKMCDGIADCPAGDDETNDICQNKCRLPYYAGCHWTRQCESTGTNFLCRDCLTGYFLPDGPDAADPATPCIPNPVLIDFTNGTQVSVDAGSGASQICVEMTVNSTEDTIADRVIMVNYTMRDGSATGGEDYTTFMGTLQFTNSTRISCIPLNILPDPGTTEVEEDETFDVVLQTSDATVTFLNSLLVVTIVETDGEDEDDTDSSMDSSDDSSDTNTSMDSSEDSSDSSSTGTRSTRTGSRKQKKGTGGKKGRSRSSKHRGRSRSSKHRGRSRSSKHRG